MLDNCMWMQVARKDVLGEYDFSKSDKFFAIKIPTYDIEEGVVYYYIELKDLTTLDIYSCYCRFRQLKLLHDALLKLNVNELPPFPKTHFWTRTNQHPKRIEERRKILEQFLAHVINHPGLRGYPEVKAISRMCKREKGKRRATVAALLQQIKQNRVKSETKASSTILSRDDWRRFSPKKRRVSLLS